MDRVDVIVIGQGLAGTTLAWHLRRRAFRVLVVDREEASSSSRIAAGLITPVTGKRLARSWRWDELFPAAVAFYRSVEEATGATFFHQRPSVRLFADEAERDEFHRRAAGILAGLVRETKINEEWFAAPFGGFEMPHAARLDVPQYLDASREVFRKHNAYVTAELDPSRDVELLANSVQLPRLERGSTVQSCSVAGSMPQVIRGSAEFASTRRRGKSSRSECLVSRKIASFIAACGSHPLVGMSSAPAQLTNGTT